MADDRVQFILRRAFREVTQNLIGLFELYDVDPRLVQQAAASLQCVYLAHLRRAGDDAGASGHTALHELLQELQGESGMTPD